MGEVRSAPRVLHARANCLGKFLPRNGRVIVAGQASFGHKQGLAIIQLRGRGDSLILEASPRSTTRLCNIRNQRQCTGEPRQWRFCPINECGRCFGRGRHRREDCQGRKLVGRGKGVGCDTPGPGTWAGESDFDHKVPRRPFLTGVNLQYFARLRIFRC